MKSTTKHTGQLGETIALEYLLREGFSLLEKNWRHRKAEIDLILQEGGTIVFIEVKTLQSDAHGSPESNITRRKLDLMWDAAGAYMDESGHMGEIRFDFISVILKSPDSYKVVHNRDAFWPGN
ncbi:MAG: YraN family protein [Saprospiraceae bacterium]|nr:YraN family protein [Saprospiraceae bacterium]